MGEIPEKLGDYRILGELGTGSFATVYRAVVDGAYGFERQVALKVLHDGVAEQDPQALELLAREALLLSRMKHPNVVGVQWFGELAHPRGASVYGMVMELVEGRTLRETLVAHHARAELLPIPVVIAVARGIAKGLSYAHQLTGEDGAPLGLVHRDLKPENVFIASTGEVKLLDFGVAHASGRFQLQGARIWGTLGYVSPEQLQERDDVDGRSDLFALGAMLYEMALGDRLIPGPGLRDYVRQLMSLDPEYIGAEVGDVHPGLGRLTASLLELDPAARVASADDVVAQLTRLQNEETVATASSWLRSAGSGSPSDSLKSLLEPRSQDSLPLSSLQLAIATLGTHGPGGLGIAPLHDELPSNHALRRRRPMRPPKDPGDDGVAEPEDDGLAEPVRPPGFEPTAGAIALLVGVFLMGVGLTLLVMKLLGRL